MVSVLTHVGIVHGAEAVGILALVLYDIGLVNPSKRFHEPGRISMLSLRLSYVDGSHVVQRRTDVSHETHKEEGQLKHGMLQELESLHDFFIPS
jgi:hypothetical protein